MNHKYAVAEMIAWAAAVNEFIQDETLRNKIALKAAILVGELAEGKVVNDMTLDEVVPSVAFLFDTIEENLNATKQGYPHA